MIGVAAVANVNSIVTSLSLVSTIIACGVFLLFISIVGLIGASKHHQVSVQEWRRAWVTAHQQTKNKMCMIKSGIERTHQNGGKDKR